MKIYTKKGDQGQTSLFGGERLSKNHIRIEAYGSVDELNSWIGLVRDSIAPIELEQELLLQIQEELFVIGSYLATKNEKSKKHLPPMNPGIVEQMEQAIDRMQESLPPMKHFILPGGHPWVSFCHIARCVCRRSERAVVSLSKQEPIDAGILPFLNRLSDYLFVLARMISNRLNAKENPWIPKHNK
ncbi:MAG: cobalamin adenosyltransferase [Vicingaceae bacterium]|nr:MAG: cobalamin adenosyltransferase [Vicingaceae bacterium]